MHFAHGDNNLSVWRYLFAALLLLSAQLATVVHASEHVFHEHTEACDVFQHAQNQLGNAQPSTELLILDYVQAISDCPALIASPLSSEADPYHQRAPPSLLI